VIISTEFGSIIRLEGLHEAAQVHHDDWRCGGVAACGAGAAGGTAGVADPAKVSKHRASFRLLRIDHLCRQFVWNQFQLSYFPLRIAGRLCHQRTRNGLPFQARKTTMFPWLISPWHAARLSWEAQRRMAFLLFGISSQEQPRQKVISDRGSRSRQMIETNTVAAVGTAIPAEFTTTNRSEKPVRNVAAAVKKPISRKGLAIKAKGTRRKRRN
jgi:hypothetical protein